MLIFDLASWQRVLDDVILALQEGAPRRSRRAGYYAGPACAQQNRIGLLP